MGPAKFRKHNRLKRNSEIKTVIRSGRKIGANWLSLFLLRRNESSDNLLNRNRGSRLAILVSKKFLRKAYQRNAFKRVAREFFRNRQGQYKNDFDIVIRVYQAPAEKNKKYFLQTIKEIFNKSGLR